MTAQAQYADIAGSWQGDKALGTVLLRADGTGEITFETDSELKMAVKVSSSGGRYTVAQAEANQPAFYEAYGFGPAAAEKISKEARPMKWIFGLSGDSSTLDGKKETSKMTYEDMNTVTSVDNSYVRDSTWKRLTGKAKAPVIGLASGSYKAAQTVTLSCPQAGTVIRYTLDGSALSETTGEVYSKPITVQNSGVLSAVATKQGWQISDVVKAEYRIQGTFISMKGKWNEFDVEIKNCFREGDNVIVDLAVTNTKSMDRDFNLCRHVMRFFSADGDVFDRTGLVLAGNEGGMATHSAAKLPNGIPVKGRVVFYQVPPEVKAIKLLDLGLGEGDGCNVLKFKDIPIASD